MEADAFFNKMIGTMIIEQNGELDPTRILPKDDTNYDDTNDDDNKSDVLSDN